MAKRARGFDAQYQLNPNAAIAKEGWFVTRWRPAMAWLYMALIAFDFMIMPLFWPYILGSWLKVPFVAWSPLTMTNGGFIHITFGAVLGLYTWGRTQEKKDPERAYRRRYYEDDIDDEEPEPTEPRRSTRKQQEEQTPPEGFGGN